MINNVFIKLKRNSIYKKLKIIEKYIKENKELSWKKIISD